MQCGEGGALLVNDPELVARAEVIQDKGTDRSRFFRGQVDKYTWQDIGSSYLLSEVASAFLWGQLEHAERITAERRAIWSRYFEALGPLEDAGLLRRPIVPPGCRHSGHLFYVLLPTEALRDSTLKTMGKLGVNAVFHYLPLHSSPGGRRYGPTGRPSPGHLRCQRATAEATAMGRPRRAAHGGSHRGDARIGAHDGCCLRALSEVRYEDHSSAGVIA